jgi:hypothetical protein
MHLVFNDLVLDFSGMIPKDIVVLRVKAHISIDVIVQLWHI